MKTICYYISDYGFGHASRSVAIIRELLRQSDICRIIVCHSFAIDFIKKSLVKENHVIYKKVSTDIGYKLNQNSLEPDIQGMNIAFDTYMESLEDLVEDEIEFCKNNNVNLILSDIVPFPFRVANEIGVPSVGISNFTWYTAYKQLIAKAKLDRLKEYYSLMDYLFSLATSNEFQWGRIEEKEFGFVSRECKDKEVQELKGKIDPSGTKTIVYFGLGMKVIMGQLDTLGLWDSTNCIFIVSGNVEVQRDNIYKIPESCTESQHYIAVSDIVITKAGWSTIAEAINSIKPLIVLNRSHMEEDKNTIQYLIDHHRAKIMDWDQIKDLTIDEDLLKELSKQKNYNLVSNDSRKVAKEILYILEQQ